MKTVYAASTNPVKVWNANQVGGVTPIKRPQPRLPAAAAKTGGRAIATIVSGHLTATTIRVDPTGTSGNCGARALKAAMNKSSADLCPPKNSNGCHSKHGFGEDDLCNISAQARMLPIIGALLGLLLGSRAGESFLQRMLATAQASSAQAPSTDLERIDGSGWNIGGPPRGYPCHDHEPVVCHPQPSFGSGERRSRRLQKSGASSASFTAFWGSVDSP